MEGRGEREREREREMKLLCSQKGSLSQGHRLAKFLFYHLSICLAALSLSWGMWILSCGMWNLVPWPGIKPRVLALGAWTLSHWTTRGVTHRADLMKVSRTDSSWKAFVVLVLSLSRVWLWDPTDRSPPGSSVHGISRQEYCSRLPFPSLGNLPDPEIKPPSPS